MDLLVRDELKVRKTPLQERSTFTVESILEAAIQVLLEVGAQRLTTTRVAARAGVSVGTLYQYFPHKRSLLFALMERHLGQLADAVERVCETHRESPIEVMAEALATAFVDAKMQRPDLSVALYSVASDLGGAALVAKLMRRSRAAVAAMLATKPGTDQGVALADGQFTADLLIAAMGGVTRAVLEASEGAPPCAKTVAMLREHLVWLCRGYLLEASGVGVS